MTSTLSSSLPAEGTSPSADVVSREDLRPRAALWALARRVHFMAGLFVAPFLAVLALTGLAYAFTPQINDFRYADELYVDQSRGTTRSMADQVAAALATHPEAHVQSVIVPGDPDRTTQVVLGGVPGLEHGADHFSAEALTVYVNPYTAAVNGELVTVNDRPPAQVWLRELHGNLNLGDPGRLYSEFVASWLPIIVVGGAFLWVGQRRRRRSARALLVPSNSVTGRARSRSWHGALGLWLAVGLLGISITGLTWSTFAGERVDAAITALDGKTPRLNSPDVAPRQRADVVTFDRAVASAREEGLQGQLTVTPPEEGKPFTVSESDEGLPIRKSTVAVDPYSAEVTARQGWEDFPLPAKLTTLGVQAHSGTLFGLANQLALAALAVGALVLLVLGYRMWWQRRPVGRRSAAAPAPVFRRVSRPLTAVIVVVCGGLAWAMPVFGFTLAGFLVADFGIRALGRRKARTA